MKRSNGIICVRTGIWVLAVLIGRVDPCLLAALYGAAPTGLTSEWRLSWSRTNEVSLGVRLLPHLRPADDWYLYVTFRSTLAPSTNNLDRAGPVRPGEARTLAYAPTAQYFMATNSTWGPMTLVDASGHEAAPLKPRTNSRESYPEVYSVNAMFSYLTSPGRGGWRSGPPLPIALQPGLGLPLVEVNRFFRITGPNDYRLTLWPKVYRRETPGSDLCRRIDLPPVSLDFHVPAPKPQPGPEPAPHHANP